MNKKDIKGRNFLLTTGILMIVAGGVSVIMALVLLLSGTFVSTMGTIGGILGTLMIMAAVLMIVAPLLELIAGIIGVKNHLRPERANTCIVWGIIVLIIEVLNLITSMRVDAYGIGTTIVAVLLGLAVPGLYLIGAILNKSATQTVS